MSAGRPADRPGSSGGDHSSPLAPLRLADDDRWLDVVREAEAPAPTGWIAGYEILDERHTGGEGVVFRARQPGTGRVVALKRLGAGAFASAAARRRFEREVEILATLDHAGIVRVLGLEEADGVAVLVMEWIDGLPLDEWSRRVEERHPPRRRLIAFRGICDAVHHAHQRGVIHRDLKPSNVLVASDDAPRVVDFGIARRVAGAADPDVTRTLGFRGTPAYAAPERFGDAADGDVRSDVYSLGVILYELLTGTRPFEARGWSALLDEVRRGDARPPSRLDRALGRDLDRIVGKAMAREPAARYQSVDALREDVTRFLDGRPVLAVPPSLADVALKWMRRNRAVALLAASLAVVALASVVVGALQMRTISRERDEATTQRLAAETARRDAERSLEEARRESARAHQLKTFYYDTIFGAITPYNEDGAARSATDVLDHASELLHDSFGEQPDLRIDVQIQLARAYMFVDDHAKALALADATDELLSAGTEVDAMLAAGPAQIRGEVALGAGDFDEAIAHLTAAVGLLRESAGTPAHDDALGAALGRLATALTHRGRWAEAERCYRESLSLTEGFSTRHSRWNTTVGLAATLVAADRFDEADAILDEVLTEARPILESNDILFARLFRIRGQLYGSMGRPADAANAWRRSVEVRKTLYRSGTRALTRPAYHLGQALVAAGRLDAALEVFSDGTLFGDPRADVYSRAAVQLSGMCLVRLGRHAEGLEILEEAWRLLPADGLEDPGRAELRIHMVAALVALQRDAEATDLVTEINRRLIASARAGAPVDPAQLDSLRQSASTIGMLAEVETSIAAAAAETP